MIVRRLLVLVLLACGLASALYVLRADARARAAEPLCPGLEPEAVLRITIGARGAAAVTLERATNLAGASFTLRERYGFPAGALELDPWLARIAALRGGARAGSDPRSAALGLGDTALEIALYAADGARLASLWQGRADGEASFLAPQSPSPATGGVWRVPHWQRVSAVPLAWIDARVPLPPSKAWTKLRFELAGRTFECERAPDSAAAGASAALPLGGRWTSGGRELPAAVLTRVAQIADALYFSDVLGAASAPEHGFDAPLARVWIDGAPGSATCELEIGALLASNAAAPSVAGPLHALRCSAWPRSYVVSINAASVGLLLDALQGLVAASDTSTESGAAPSKH
jgi:hypothetical protein